MPSLANSDSGSRWYKTDFQIASPLGGFKLHGADLESTDGRKRAAVEYVKLLKDTGLDAFAVMDHNSTKMLKEVRDAAKSVGLVMFPGMEVSTGSGADGIHLLLIGDPEADIDALTHAWNQAAGFTIDNPPFDERGKHVPSSRSITDILDALPPDTIAIGPHVLNDNGIANMKSIAEGSLRWRILHHDRLEAIDVGTPSDDGDGQSFNARFRARTLDRFPALKRLAYVATSDAYSPEALGRHTWIRMHQLDLESLRQALLDHEARVRPDWDPRISGDPNEVDHAHITSITLDGVTSSTEPLTVHFDPRVTVLIGSRGSGKSTVIQGLRALYGAQSDLPETIDAESTSYQREVFPEAELTSSFVEAISGTEGTVTWSLRDGSTVTGDQAGIPVRIMTQKELFERTSGSSSGERSASANMLSLVDEALSDDQVVADLVGQSVDMNLSAPGSFTTALEHAQTRFVEACSRRLDAERTVETRPRVIADLDQVKRKLNALDDAKEKERLAAAQVILNDDTAVTGYVNLVRDLAEEIEELAFPDAPSLAGDEAKELTSALTSLIDETRATFRQASSALRQAAEDLETEGAAEGTKYARSVFAAKQTKADYQHKLSTLGVNVDQYEALEGQQVALKEQLAEIADTAKTLEGLAAAEATAWAAIDHTYALRRSTRAAFLRIVGERSPSLRFTIRHHSDSNSWRASVRSELGLRQGTHLESLQNLAGWLWNTENTPEEAADRLATWRDSLLRNEYRKLTDAGVVLTTNFVDRLAAVSEAQRIQLTTLRADDALEMEFLKQGHEPENAESWQSVTHGSPGQRSAAMLAFVLSYGDSPLVLDQPEDDLDSALISELVVTQFRKGRWHRQLIIATHEANIPVNTDAESVVVLENVGGVLKLAGPTEDPIVGPIDKPEIRQSIQALLEGGVRAFINRERRYNNELSQYRTDMGLS